MERVRRPRAASGGFTLVELLVVLVIMPLIIAAVADAVITTLANDAAVSASLSASANVRTVEAFFVRDVQSARSASTTRAQTPCEGYQTCTLELALEFPNAAVSYWFEPDPTDAPRGDIWRVFCSPSMPQSRVPVVRDIPEQSVQISATGSDGLVTLTMQAMRSDISMTLTGAPRSAADGSQPSTCGP